MCYSNGRAGVIGDDEQLELPSFFNLGEKLAVCGEYISGRVLIRNVLLEQSLYIVERFNL